MTFRLKVSGICLALLLAACGGDSNTPASPSKSPQAANRVIQAVEDPYAQIIQRLYVGYFGRPADADGLIFFAAQLRALNAPTTLADLRASYYTNADIRRLIDGFSTSQESQDLYPGENGTFIDAIYNNAFGREADAEGRAYWVAGLNRGEITRANAVLEILAAAQSADSGVMDLKTQMASEFTTGLNTPERVQAYQGGASSYLARAMLTQAFPAFNMTILRPVVQQTLDQLDQSYAVSRLPYEEVPAGERRIALLASASQLAANSGRLHQLADVLAADLSTRDRGYGPTWKVDILSAGSTVASTREKLRGYHGTILIGDVPIATHDHYVSGWGILGSIEPYRLPECPLYRFEADGNTITAPPQLYQFHPACRNGQVVALLHGRTPEADIAEVASKLDQMVAYHRASAASNAQWAPAYKFVTALWAGGLAMWGDLSSTWSKVPLYASGQYNYPPMGTAKQNKAAIIDCLTSNAEVCVLNAHGGPELVSIEGPGTIGEFYSSDSATLDVNEVRSLDIRAKYISLVSCSTQNLLVQNNLGANLLMSGKALLTYGMNGEVLVSNEYERLHILKNYVPLALGATFAEASAGDDESPEILQGDPFITMRPVPADEWPKLAIDGKRYHGVNAVANIQFPDTDVNTKVLKTIVLSNRGRATLKVRAEANVNFIGPDLSGQDGVKPQIGGVGINIEAPIRMRPGGVGSGMTFDEYELKAGESLPVTLSLQPYTLGEHLVKPGGYQGRLILISNDPAAPHIALELHGNVKAAP